MRDWPRLLQLAEKGIAAKGLVEFLEGYISECPSCSGTKSVEAYDPDTGVSDPEVCQWCLPFIDTLSNLPESTRKPQDHANKLEGRLNRAMRALRSISVLVRSAEDLRPTDEALIAKKAIADVENS